MSAFVLQVYLLSFAKEDALTQWMRKLNTAMIIGETFMCHVTERGPPLFRFFCLDIIFDVFLPLTATQIYSWPRNIMGMVFQEFTLFLDLSW